MLITHNLEQVSSLVFNNILKFLDAKDVFNLGLCSQQLNKLVINECYHPLSTELQCIKIMVKHYFKENTVYDRIEPFPRMEKCGKIECKCQTFRQRRTWIIKDPAFCESCDQ